MNTITCHDNSHTFDAAGERVGRVREHLRDALSIPADATPVVAGRPARDDDLLPADAGLEFLKVSGRKAMGQVWTPDEFCRHCKITRDRLDLWVQQGLPVLPLKDGDFRVAEAAFDESVLAQVRAARGQTGAVVSEAGPGHVPRQSSEPTAARPGGAGGPSPTPG